MKKITQGQPYLPKLGDQRGVLKCKKLPKVSYLNVML